MTPEFPDSTGSPPGRHAANPQRPLEVEIKLRPASLDAVLARAAALGFAVHTARSFESNVLFDTPESSLRAAGQILRLREYAGECVLTFKGASMPGKHKVREEIETGVGDARQFQLLLSRLNYHATFRYEKYRTVYARTGEDGLLTVDETPIGAFLELEGSPEWIDRIAAALGFPPETYITESYGQLWLKHCAAEGIPAGDFVFAPEGSANR